MSEVSKASKGDSVSTEVFRSEQIIDKKPRKGILKTTVRSGDLYGSGPIPEPRELIDSSIETMLSEALQQANQQGLESTLQSIDNLDEDGNHIGSRNAGEDAKHGTAFRFAYEIENDIKHYKTLLSRFDNADIDDDTRKLVEQLIVKMIKLTHAHHLMWVADYERYILAGASNLNASTGFPEHIQRAAVAKLRQLKRLNPQSTFTENHKIITAEFGSISPTSLRRWDNKI